MQRIVFHEYGNPLDVLKVEQGPEPGAPGPGEVLIKIHKRPIHNGDLLMVNGGHDPVERAIPPSGYSVGCEGVGIIQAIGTGIDASRGLHAGARVSFFALGTWQDLLLVKADYVALIPRDLEDDLAAQLFVNPIAAMMLTRLVSEIASHPQAGVLQVGALEAVVEDLSASRGGEKVVLLSVAGSTVARLAAAILKAQGFVPIGLVRSSSSALMLQEATGMVVLGFDDKNWKNNVRKAAAGRNIFAALDAVGGKIGEEILGLLSPSGTLISYGSLTGEPIPVDHVHLCMTAKKICGIGMVHWTQLPYETRAADIPTLIQMVKDNRQCFNTAGEFPLSEIIDAVRLFRQPGRRGTVLLRPDDS